MFHALFQKYANFSFSFATSYGRYIKWLHNLPHLDYNFFLTQFHNLVKQDDNRYNASRGAHLNLKRAEKARILVNKIPGIY